MSSNHFNKELLVEVLGSEINYEVEKDILEFINCEIAVDEQDLFQYFQSIQLEDSLY
ncbi:hypothetical protein [Bacillus sp. OAE603]|uniref:hypothetical protein n=1 Tax=Gottfriedia sp. OAE603 TaxID=2663872 RepID=UPI00178963C6